MDYSDQRTAGQVAIVVRDGRVAAGLFIEQLIVAAGDPDDNEIRRSRAETICEGLRAGRRLIPRGYFCAQLLEDGFCLTLVLQGIC